MYIKYEDSSIHVVEIVGEQKYKGTIRQQYSDTSHINT